MISFNKNVCKVFPFLNEAIHDAQRHHHNDFRSSVPIFDKRLMLDFYWRPYLTDDGLMQSIQEWADPNWRPKNLKIHKTNVIIPHLLLLGRNMRINSTY